MTLSLLLPQVQQLAWHKYDFMFFGAVLIVAFFSALTCLTRATISSKYGHPVTVSVSSVFVALATYAAIRYRKVSMLLLNITADVSVAATLPRPGRKSVTAF